MNPCYTWSMVGLYDQPSFFFQVPCSTDRPGSERHSRVPAPRPKNLTIEEENAMPNFGVWEWLIILVIVLVIFGASRLKGLGQGLGGAINAFRSEVKSGQEDQES